MAVIVALILLEVGVRLVAPQDLNFYDAERIMRRSARPGQSIELIPNTRNPSYVGVPVRVNSLGLRGAEVAIPKPDGVFRILAIGDSVTFGFGVREEESYAERVRALLSTSANGSRERVEVVNAGVEGTGLDYYLNFLRANGQELEPDLILVGIVLNDIADYHGGGGRGGAPVYGSPVVRRVHRFLRTQSHLYLFAYMRLKSALYRVGVLDINRTPGARFLTLEALSERQARAWRSSLSVLGDMLDTGARLGMPMVLVVFPMEVQLDKAVLDQYRRMLGMSLDDRALTGEPQRRLAEFASSRHVPMVDLLPVFRAAHARLLYLRNKSISHDWVHPSAEGHAVAASAVLESLRTLDLARH